MYEDYYGYYSTPMYRQRITIEQATQNALQSVPGQVVYASIDIEEGVSVFEIFILNDQEKLFEVTVNMKTGEVLEIEEEND